MTEKLTIKIEERIGGGITSFSSVSGFSLEELKASLQKVYHENIDLYFQDPWDGKDLHKNTKIPDLTDEDLEWLLTDMTKEYGAPCHRYLSVVSLRK